MLLQLSLPIAAVMVVGCAAPAPTLPTTAAVDATAIAMLDAYGNFDATLSPDGKHVVFLSNRNATVELFVADVDRPDAAPVRLVAGPERVASAVFTPDGRDVIFRRDTGADENFHILRIGVDGAGLVDLTPDGPDGPIWRDSPMLPRARPDLLVYGARKPTDLASSIVVHRIGEVPTVVHRDPAPGTILDVLPDARFALWWREAASGGHDLLEVDLGSGVARPISPRDGTPERVTSGAYSADGTRIYVATDHGGERHVVEALDRETLAPVATYVQDAPPTAEIVAIVPAPTGDRLAITIDAGNHSTVRILDAHTLTALVDVGVPLGTIAAGVISETRVRLPTGVFRDDGARFTIDVSLPSAPDDIYVVDAATGRASPLRHEPRAALAKLPPVEVSIVEVPSFDGTRVPVNVLVPAGARHRPVIVWLHGGPDASTSLEWSSWTSAWLAAGYVVLQPNVRGSTGFGRAYAHADDGPRRADALRDLEAVHAWATAQPWCDRRRMVIAGASFGGYYTLMALAHQPARWAAGIDLAGPSDLVEVATGAARRYAEELGDPIADRARLVELSPIRAIDRVIAPLFVYHGANDAHVPRAHADAVVAALRRRAGRVDYMLALDEGHTVVRRANRIELLSRMLRFLDAALRPRP